MEKLILAKNLIEKSRDILVFSSPELQGDNLGSVLALFYTLKKSGGNVNTNIGDVPEKFRFLIGPLAANSDNFIISINTEGKEISQMRYEKNHKDLKIYLALNGGRIKNDDVSFAPFPNAEIISSHPDLLITVGVQSLENIPQSFWNSPILNIDNHPQNENFGEVNLIEMTSSLAEIVTNLIKSMGKEELLSKEAAACLLTGVIWSSQNFRSPKTRPKTFETAAFLIEKGANHQEIIQHLYKQKNISQIKLLGKVLEKLIFHETKEIYAANLAERDFQECRANSKDLAFVLEELKFHFRHLPNLLILWKSRASPPLTKGIFYSPRSDLIEKITANFESASRGSGVLFLIREPDPNIACEKVLQIL